MNTIIIPENLSKERNLIAVPRKDYEEFLTWQKKIKSVKTYKPTKSELKALERGRKNFAKGNYVTLRELENELDGNR